MKKTLFLALALGFSGLSQATVTPVNGNTHITGTESVSTLSGPVHNVVNVGSSLGSGEVTVDADWLLPNSLYIGGVGYRTGATTANQGTVTVLSGYTLTVGGAAGTSAGAHIDVGNSVNTAASGSKLVIDGGDVQAAQLVVGAVGGASGIVEIKNGGTLTLNNMGDVAGFEGIHLLNGEVIVDNGTLNNEDSVTFIGDTDSSTLTVKDTANLGDVVIGDTGSGTTGELKVSGGNVNVSGDLWVSETGTLTVDKGSLTVNPTEDKGIWVEQNASVNIGGADAQVAAARVELGQGAKMTIKDSANLNSGVLGLQAGATVNMMGTASITDSAAQQMLIAIDPGADIYMEDSTNITVSEVLFTVTDANQDATSGNPMGQIHCATDTALTDISKASVVIDGSYLDSLVSGQREIVLVSAPTGTDAHTTPDDISVIWGVHTGDNFDDPNREINYTVKLDSEGNAEGVKLQLNAVNPNNPGQGADDLANQIIDALLSPTSTATINTLNGSVAAMGGLFNVVKNQLQMPHNIEQPVGNVADDSRLAYTGRYYVGANRAWASAMGEVDRVATDGHGIGYHYQGGGYAVGYDRVITPQMYVGAAVGQMFGKYKSNNDLMRDNQTTIEGTLYAHYTHEMRKSANRFNVDAYVGAGRARNRATGSLSKGSQLEATGRWDDTMLGAGVRLSYDIVLSDEHIVTPFIGIEGIHAMQDRYTITNGKSTIHYHDGEASLWTVPVGVTYRYIMAVDKTEYIVPQVTVAYLGDISRKEPRVKYDWTSGTGEVRGARPACSGFEVEAGAAWILSSEWSTGAFYTIDQRRGDCDQQVKAFVSYSF